MEQVRKKQMVFLELEHLLNLLFASSADDGGDRWKKQPYANALDRFCAEATKVVAREDLRNHVLAHWIPKKGNSLSIQSSVSLTELMESKFGA